MKLTKAMVTRTRERKKKRRIQFWLLERMEKEFGKVKEKETGEASQEDLEAYGILPPVDEDEEEGDA